MALVKTGAISFVLALIGGALGTIFVLWLRAIWPATVSDSSATLITGLLGAGVGLFAVVIAIWGVVSSRSIARSQTTMAYMASLEADGSVQAARAKFNDLVRTHGSLSQYADKQWEGTPELQSIVTVLNEFELISIGIQRGIIDPELYRRWNHSNVQLYWKNAQQFVVALRSRVDRPSLYHEFEELARWMNQNRVPHRRFWWAGII